MNAPARAVIAQRGMLVIAHRGASADVPENTVPAFLRALEVGAEFVELDYRHSRDGVPVVIHDETLDRTTDDVARWGGARLRVDARTARELGELEAGAWRHANFRGARIPTLADALEVIEARAVAVIERKTGDPETLLELLASRGLVERVVVQAFDWDFLTACRARSPHLVLGALGEGALTRERLRRLEGAGAAVAGWEHGRLDAAVAADVHAAGLRLWAYTVNDPARALALRGLGVDGIITDRPEAIRAALGV